MSLKSVLITSTTNWPVPPTVSAVMVKAQAPGGGGGASIQFQDSKAGGGAGEACHMQFIPVTPSGTLSIVIGAVGAGGVPSVSNPTSGGSVIVGDLILLGGEGAHVGAGATVGGSGGGPNGGSGGIALTPGSAGLAESPRTFGGMGANGGGQKSGSTPLYQIGQYAGVNGADAAAPFQHGGGAGAPTAMGRGATGGSNGVAPLAPGPYGGGGAGACQRSIGGIGQAGSDGGAAGVWLFYMEAA